MAIVQRELGRIANIVQRLLEFQRPAAGQRAPQDVGHLLDEVLTLAGKQLQRAGVTVQRQGPARLSPVLADGNQLQQVFLNLVLNAIEAMPEGGELRITTDQAADTLTVTFADTGEGLSAEAMRHLFEPFFSTKHEGTGLGLAVSHEIVTAHGGALEASSRRGGGSVFTVSLPTY